MNIKQLFQCAICASSLIFSTASLAVDFSTGVGYPFVGVPTVSISDDNVRYYANYKLGLDDGFSVGAEWLNGKHAFGAFAGAIGARDVEACNENVILCISIFDNETTNGLGLSYEYHFSESPKSGWGIRFEAGYGKESYFNEKRVDGNVQITYHF